MTRVRLISIGATLLAIVFCSSVAIAAQSTLVVNFTSQMNGGDVQFTDMSSTVGHTETAWHWDFGDGGRSTEKSPSHVYNQTGLYTVILQVTDDSGTTRSGLKNIDVSTLSSPPLVDVDLIHEASLLVAISLGIAGIILAASSLSKEISSRRQHAVVGVALMVVALIVYALFASSQGVFT